MLIGGLDLCYLIHVFEADSSSDLVSWFPSSLFNACCFLQEVRGWRRFSNECKGAIRLNCYEGWRGDPLFNMCRLRVKFFAEVHRLDSTGTKGRSDGRRRSSFPSWDEETLQHQRTLDWQYISKHIIRLTTTCALAFKAALDIITGVWLF